VHRDQSENEEKLNRCMSKIIDRVEKNHSMFKMRYIMVQWRDFVTDRKRHIKSLSNAVQKTLWQNAFTTIRLYSEGKRARDAM
jgi:hypothetical protein